MAPGTSAERAREKNRRKQKTPRRGVKEPEQRKKRQTAQHSTNDSHIGSAANHTNNCVIKMNSGLDTTAVVSKQVAVCIDALQCSSLLHPIPCWTTLEFSAIFSSHNLFGIALERSHPEAEF
jgi:hypothetical protein